MHNHRQHTFAAMVFLSQIKELILDFPDKINNARGIVKSQSAKSIPNHLRNVRL
jgi:hypothetical protein